MLSSDGDRALLPQQLLQVYGALGPASQAAERPGSRECLWTHGAWGSEGGSGLWQVQVGQPGKPEL